MSTVLAYAVKAFDWEGAAFTGTFSFGLIDKPQAPDFDQTKAFVPEAAPVPVTFDAFPIAGALTIEGLGLRGVALSGIEFVSPKGPPLCMILIATDNSGASVSLFPGDPRFETVEGPLEIGQQVWTLIGQKTG